MDRFVTFATTISAIYRMVQQIKTKEMKRLGLKSTHVMCLYHLGKAPEGLTAAELCRMCKEDKAAISRCVHALAQRGYIRMEEKEDGRTYRAKIILTPEGAQVVTYINERISCALEAVGGSLDEKDRKVFYRCLLQITDRLQQYVKQG